MLIKFNLFYVLATISIAPTSCRVCADCECKTYTTQPGVSAVETVTEVCGNSEIKDKRGVHTTKVTVNGQTYTITEDCTCRYN